MEIRLCGESAVKACAQARPAALREILADERAARSRLAPTLDFLRAEIAEAGFAQKIAIRTVPAAELAHFAGTHAHGGIAALTERPESAQIRPAMREEWFAAGERVLFVFGVSEPAQLASVARVAVACGVSRLIADERETVPALAHSRTWSRADGALEFLKIYRTESPAGALRLMSARFFTVGFVREGGRRVDYAKIPVFPGKSVAFVLGGSENGIPAEIAAHCDYLLHISENAAAPIRLAPAEIAAHALPWIFSKKKRAGAGFRSRHKNAPAGTSAEADFS